MTEILMKEALNTITLTPIYNMEHVVFSWAYLFHFWINVGNMATSKHRYLIQSLIFKNHLIIKGYIFLKS
jgi:hypothetical protein